VGLLELELKNFRIFETFSLRPDPTAVTVLFSPNGTGKTSVLEAVFALATASSFRTTSAGDMVKQGEHQAEVHGVLLQGERRVQVDLTLTRGVRNVTKRMLVNGQRPQSRAELGEVLPVTIFTPEVVDMIRQGPEHRRQFVTTLLTDVEPPRGPLLEHFEQTLRQRNALLRSMQGLSPPRERLDELEVWTEDFVAVATSIVDARTALLQKLSPLVEHFYQQLAGEDSKVLATYETSWDGDLRQALRDELDHDLYRGFTGVGPHRDDVAIVLNGKDARRRASQGEQRSLALALRLAGHELVEQERNVVPLLLLDDVFSELDELRSDRLLRLLPTGQTIVTTASPLPGHFAPAVVLDVSRAQS
jgi:DNA replication and repair protein RecF